jgi:hypothetical protein
VGRTAAIVYWFDEAGTIRDGGGIRAFAWRDALHSLGFDVNFVGLLPAPAEGDSAKGRLSSIKRSIMPLPFERKLPAFERANLTVLTVPGVFRSGARQLRGRPVILDWMDLWSDFAASSGDGLLAKAGGYYQSGVWRKRERLIPGSATHNTYAGHHDYLMQSGRSQAASSWLPTPQPLRTPRDVHRHPTRLGFIGNMNYAPNELDLRAFLAENAARLTAAGYEIVVAGFGSEKVSRWGFPIEVVGPVADTASFYEKVDAAIVPVSSGSGIKAKAVEALSFGVPVLGTHHVRNGFAPEFSPYILDIGMLLGSRPEELPIVPRELYTDRLSPAAFTRHVDMITRSMT